jgi:hypothetical protein
MSWQNYGPPQGGGGAPVLLPPGPGMMGGGQQGGGGGQGGYAQGGPPQGNFMQNFGFRGQQQPGMGGGGYYPGQQGGMPPGGGYPGGGGGMPGGGGGYSSQGRMQGIAGPNVARSLGSINSSAAAPKMHLFQKTLRDMITGMRQHKNPADQQRFLHKCMAEMRDEARACVRAEPHACAAPPQHGETRVRRVRVSAPRRSVSAARCNHFFRPGFLRLTLADAAAPLPVRSPRTKQVKSTDVRTKAFALEKMAYLHMLGYDMSWAAFHVVEARTRRRARSTPLPRKPYATRTRMRTRAVRCVLSLTRCRTRCHARLRAWCPRRAGDEQPEAALQAYGLRCCCAVLPPGAGRHAAHPQPAEEGPGQRAAR